MKWFEGDIASAINQAKSQNAIFVVYCEGQDDVSKKITEHIENTAVSSLLESKTFVAIKIKSEEEAYTQFAKIYQLVPVPSIFFIKNGIPIKVVAGNVKSVEELVEAINGVKNSESIPQQQSLAQSSTSPSDSEVVCEDGVCYKKPKAPELSDAPPSPEKNETEEEKQEKIKKAMKLIEQKRIERIKEEQSLEKEKEVQRRKEGQDMVTLKKWKEDQELKQIKEDQLRDKNEAKAARQRVLDQIEQDKKERAQRFAMQQGSNDSKPAKPPTPTTPSPVSSDTARVQFKKPNGDSEIVTFDSSMLFTDLHVYVKNEILQGSVKEFTLATAFPRREFSQVDFEKTLQDLNLTPTSTMLIIPGKKSVKFAPSSTTNVLPTQTDGTFFSMMSALFFGLMTPVMALFTYLKSFIMRGNQGEAGENASEAGKRKRNEDILTPNDAAKKRNLNILLTNQPQPGTSTQSSSPTGAIPKSTVYKRQNPSNNVHRLHENSDDEEDKKTYNGNSTQQL